jgi:hypothetical protein
LYYASSFSFYLKLGFFWKGTPDKCDIRQAQALDHKYIHLILAEIAFVRELIAAKEAAEKRAHELELENFAWKAALKAKDEDMVTAKNAADAETDAMAKRLSTLQRDFGSLKVRKLFPLYRQ